MIDDNMFAEDNFQDTSPRNTKLKDMGVNMTYAHISILMDKLETEMNRHAEQLKRYSEKDIEYEMMVEKKDVDNLIRTNENLLDYLEQLMNILGEMGIKKFKELKNISKEKIIEKNKPEEKKDWNEVSKEEKEKIANKYIEHLERYSNNLNSVRLQWYKYKEKLKKQYNNFPKETEEYKKYYKKLNEELNDWEDIPAQDKEDILFRVDKVLSRDLKFPNTFRSEIKSKIYYTFRLKQPIKEIDDKLNKKIEELKEDGK